MAILIQVGQNLVSTNILFKKHNKDLFSVVLDRKTSLKIP